jgi:aryl-alcohol dehydrogenase-like predicted oxidoreductase
MEYRKLGRTDVKVSAICLGTMTWGQQNTEAEGHEQMDYGVDQGINFFDTAELYSIPPRAETQGSTERIIGSWFASRGGRDRIILATKVVGRSQWTYFRDGETSRLHRKHIMHAVEGSLRRLRTDYIDLYQLHWPDRDIQVFATLNYKHSDDWGVPIEETLGVLGELVEQGKIRHIGLSNETAWGTMKFLHHAETRGLPRIASIQNVYNLLSQNFEHGLSEIALREDVGLLAYSPLAQGYLTGKYQNGALPEGSRKQLFNRSQRFETPGAPAAIEAYLKIARDHDLNPAQMALQWVTTRPFVTSNIIGATTMDQLRMNIDSVHVELNKEVLEAIEHTNLLYTYPCP